MESLFAMAYFAKILLLDTDYMAQLMMLFVSIGRVCSLASIASLKHLNS